jgi:hypothetical protein
MSMHTSINANIRILSTSDAERLWYDTGTPYGNTGTLPATYSGGYLARYDD